MSNMIKYLNWDSEFFKLCIGRVDIQTKEDWARLKEVVANNPPFNLIYVFDNNSGESPLDSSFLVDTKVVYAKTITDMPESVSSFVYPYEASIPDDDLYSLALASGRCSRYKLDLNFPSGSYERLYRRWIENSVTGKMADIVICYVERDRKRGMITLSVRDETASIGLLAVDPSFRRKGIGYSLIQAAEIWLIKKGIRHFEVATQNDNVPGCKFYEKCGFERISETKIYHIWL